MPISS